MTRIEAESPDAAPASVDDLRQQVALGCRILAAAGHDDLIWGHVGARDPDGRGAWMKASGLGMDEIGGGDVVLVDRDGAVVEGDGRRHIEYPIHTEILAARPDVGGIAHTHAPHAVALAAAGQPLRPVSHAATLFVPPDIPRFQETGDLIRTPELGCSLVATLSGHDSVFLVNHGIVTVGVGVADAVVRAVMLERACAAQRLVRTYGGLATWSSADESLSKRDNIFSPDALQEVFAYLARRLGP